MLYEFCITFAKLSILCIGLNRRLNQARFIFLIRIISNVIALPAAKT